jgi:hypothetical protein
MLCFTMLPVAVWCVLQYHAPIPLHRYDRQSAAAMFAMNIFSVGILIAVFGWLQADIYRRMERPAPR